MGKNKYVNYLLRISGLVISISLLIYLIYTEFSFKAKSKRVTYGVKANDLRKKLFIPIIDEYMSLQKQGHSVDGGRWVSKKEFPENLAEVLHVWKTVSSTNGNLYEEIDAFRKKRDDSSILQLNIDSKILNDSTATRYGRFFRFGKVEESTIKLDDKGIDSIAKEWGILYLIRK